MTARSWGVARQYVFWPLLVGLFALLAGLVAGRKRLRAFGWLSLGAAGLTALFFRDPERRLEPENGVIYAAADGLVTDVDEVDEPWISGGRAGRVSVFLNLQNVHVNRSPFAGRIEKMEQSDGGFSPALFGGVEDNYSNRTLVDGERGPFVIVQRAGMIARRISPWVEEGQTVDTGERIGIIHFGSRTDVLLPPGEATFLVEPGDKVRAGLTPIARYRNTD
ncbi:MAG: phosphatidylserine decarboxylase [Rubrobacteraceae bacterium]